jgi:hypothetical protein
MGYRFFEGCYAANAINVALTARYRPTASQIVAGGSRRRVFGSMPGSQQRPDLLFRPDGDKADKEMPGAVDRPGTTWHVANL